MALIVASHREYSVGDQIVICAFQGNKVIASDQPAVITRVGCTLKEWEQSTLEIFGQQPTPNDLSFAAAAGRFYEVTTD